MRLCVFSQQMVPSELPHPSHSTRGRSSAEAVGLRELGTGRRAPSQHRAAPPTNALEIAGVNKGNLLPGPSPSVFPSPIPPVGSPLCFPYTVSSVPSLPRNKSVPAVAAQTTDANARCLAFWIFTGDFLSPLPPCPAPGSRRALPISTPGGRPP